MAIEDPDLIRQSRKASRRRLLANDIMQTLTKLDRITNRMLDLSKAQRRQADRFGRLLANMQRPERIN